MKRITSRKADLRAIRPVSLAGMIVIFLLAAATCAGPYLLAETDKKDSKENTAESSKVLKGLPAEGLTVDEAILQALNRMGFGPRPGDLERVKEIGLQKWIDQQLHPDSIVDSALDARLERFPTLKMSSAKLVDEFPEAKVAARREGITVEEYRKEQQEQMRSAMQSMPSDIPSEKQSDVQMADSHGMPSFDTDDMDANANPVKAKGEGKGQGGFSNQMFNYEKIRTPQRIVAELSMAKMTRAVYSERQLQEIMVDFWYNHFNVYAAKGADRWLITEYERDAIRPYAMGKFRDLLGATAKSPAMLFFLDNWLSADPVAWQKLQQEQKEREIRGGGMKDGEQVLDILARDPHTAHHISFELAQRFVSDNPPSALVDRMAQTFLKSDGDIREVLHTMIYSPEFWSKESYHAKIKTPFELVASATRAVGAEVEIPLMLVQWTGRIGQPLYQCEPPTGYSDNADAWVNTGALLSRMNFSLALTSNRLRGAQVNIDSLSGSDTAANPHATLGRAIQLLLGGAALQQTRDTLEKQLDDPQILQATLDDKVKQVNAAIIAGLVLGSPEFQ